MNQKNVCVSVCVCVGACKSGDGNALFILNVLSIKWMDLYKFVSTEL